MDDLTPTQKRERADLALNATYEIEVVVEMLKQNLPADMNCLGLACLVRRVQDLNSVIMSALGTDDNRETEEMRKVVFL
jgi:hypothetical protein